MSTRFLLGAILCTAIAASACSDEPSQHVPSGTTATTSGMAGTGGSGGDAAPAGGGGAGGSGHAGGTSAAEAFLAAYQNPAEQAADPQGVYPTGRRMWLAAYSNDANQLTRMHEAGFTMAGPHYAGAAGPPDWAEAAARGMKSFFRLRISSYNGNGGWLAVLPRMTSSEGREEIRSQLWAMIDTVLADSAMNDAIACWYGYPEEAMGQVSGYSLADQRAYMAFVQQVVAERDDVMRRPLAWSERGDANPSTMTGNVSYGSAVLKQNYLIKSNNYHYGDDPTAHRFLMGQWIRDQIAAASAHPLPYTGVARPVISTLSMYVDPEDPAERNETWLREAIAHDFWLQLAMGAHGFVLYSWSNSANWSQTTKDLQENIYLDIIDDFTERGLPAVFLWGDERDDLTLSITDGPETFEWMKYSNTFTEPSVKLRNIQYGQERYLLLVNSAPYDAVVVELAGLPAEGVQVVDLATDEQLAVTADKLVTTLEPRAHQMVRVELAADG